MDVMKPNKIGTTGVTKGTTSSEGRQVSFQPGRSSFSNAGMKRSSRSSSSPVTTTKPNISHMPKKPK